MSGCLSVTLVDCDHIVQRKVEIGRWQVDTSVSWLPACRSRSGSWYPVIPNATEKYRWKNAEFCTSVAIISTSNGSHVALSQHLLSFLSPFKPTRRSSFLWNTSWPYFRHFKRCTAFQNYDKVCVWCVCVCERERERERGIWRYVRICVLLYASVVSFRSMVVIIVGSSMHSLHLRHCCCCCCWRRLHH